VSANQCLLSFLYLIEIISEIVNSRFTFSTERKNLEKFCEFDYQKYLGNFDQPNHYHFRRVEQGWK